MFKAILDFFIITPEVKPEFLAAAQRHNRLSLLVICVMIFGMELFNMARVLFWSASGLGTLNNRIYFAFYSSLFLPAARVAAAPARAGREARAAIRLRGLLPCLARLHERL